MTLTNTCIDAYCRRIGYDGPHTPTLHTLRALHERHPRAITFENLGPWLGAGVTLDPDTLFDKLVTQGRGGYCFEQNGLFRLVLDAMGFSVTGLSARVLWNLPEDARPPRTHQALLVQVQGQEWLADVGFGGLTPLAPLRLVPERIQDTPLESFRLRQRTDGLLLEAMLPSGPKPMYLFQPEPAAPADFVQSNWFVSTHPDSRFVNHLVCTRVRGNDRHNLVDRDHTIYQPGQAPRTQHIPDGEALLDLLATVFELPVAQLPALPARLRHLCKD